MKGSLESGLPVAYSGFCVGGIDWPRPELAGVSDAEQRRRILREIASDEARMTSSLGGNLLRLFYSVSALLATTDENLANVFPATLDLHPRGVATSPIEERLDLLDRAAASLNLLFGDIQEARPEGLSFDFAALDTYLAGVEDFNNEVGDDEQGVRALLTLVSLPPRFIVEAPSACSLQSHGREYTYDTLWNRYLRVHELLHRALVDRYVATPLQRGDMPVVCAFEVGNEPDYCWIPAEMKIEWGSEAGESPLWKYVTELHLSQVPERGGSPPPMETTPTGYQARDVVWLETQPRTSIVEFDWGSKFDWYVKSFADLQERTAESLADEAKKHSVDVEIVSGSVTHNNIDYLLRMAQANPRTFSAITKLGLHPYHWVENDVWDDHFIDTDATNDWQSSSPRDYARSHFKRFDFLEELAARARGDQSRFSGRITARGIHEAAQTLVGKALWITEFGVGTKTLGTFNSEVAESWSSPFAKPVSLALTWMTTTGATLPCYTETADPAWDHQR